MEEIDALEWQQQAEVTKKRRKETAHLLFHMFYEN